MTRGQLIVCLGLPLGGCCHVIVTFYHVIIWTNKSPADVLRLSPRADVKLIHVDRSDLKLSMSPDSVSYTHLTLPTRRTV